MPLPVVQGTHADRPAASSANRGLFYYETNTAGGTLFQSDGVTWNQAGPPQVQTYKPTLGGATDNAVPTFSVQIGRYYTVGKLCFVSITLVSTTMTKTTLTDHVRISLPVAAANNAGQVGKLAARLENGTAVVNATQAETVAGAAYLHLRDVPDGAASVVLTYDLTTGIGVLTNTITIEISGWYETV